MPSLLPLFVLDLDETLIHATDKLKHNAYDFMVFHYYVYQRPHLQEFITTCAKYFQLAIWSSASDDYVEQIVANIIPDDVSLAFCWGRSRCTPRLTLSTDDIGAYIDTFSGHYNYTKQFKKIRKKGYNLQQVLVVEDTPSKVANCYGNAIYVHPFEGATTDTELLSLKDYLINIKDFPNFRALEKRFWRDNL